MKTLHSSSQHNGVKIDITDVIQNESTLQSANKDKLK